MGARGRRQFHDERVEVGGVTVLDWFTAMIDGADEWVDLVDESLE
jgi:hypothetical protein